MFILTRLIRPLTMRAFIFRGCYSVLKEYQRSVSKLYTHGLQAHIYQASIIPWWRVYVSIVQSISGEADVQCCAFEMAL